MYWYAVRKRDLPTDVLEEDWSDFDQVGEVFGGRLLTAKDVADVEEKYIRAISLFLAERRVEQLRVEDVLPGEPDETPASLKVGDVLTIEEALTLCRLALHNRTWLHLTANDTAIYFGMDLYVFLGASSPCEEAISVLRSELGLSVKEGLTPY